MTKSFKALRELMSSAAQARASEKTASMIKDLARHGLRRAPQLTEGTLAEQLDLEQPSVSELERRTALDESNRTDP